MTDMANITSTTYPVTGVATDTDVKKALQALYDVFADQSLGQATFEITEDHAQVVIKHKDSVTPDVTALNEALAKAGNFRINQ